MAQAIKDKGEIWQFRANLSGDARKSVLVAKGDFLRLHGKELNIEETVEHILKNYKVSK